MRRLLKDDALFGSIEISWQDAALSEKRRAMLDYAVKLTHQPGDMVRNDVDALRLLGFSDRDILDITEVVSYYAYVNRIADGLGVQPEAWIVDE